MSTEITVIADGAVGMTGYTRCIVRIKEAAASNTIEFPKTFIPEFLAGLSADKPGCFYESEGVYKLDFTAAPTKDVVAVIGGVLGRRDFGPRTVSNYMSENPNTNGRP